MSITDASISQDEVPLLAAMKTPESRVDSSKLADLDLTHDGLAENSNLATEAEHTLTVRQAIILYRPAMFWSVFFCIGQMMTAFDPQILGNLFAMPAFQRDFGYLFEDSYIISAPWQTGLLMGVPIGQVVGSLGAGPVISRYGCKKTLGFVFLERRVVFSFSSLPGPYQFFSLESCWEASSSDFMQLSLQRPWWLVRKQDIDGARNSIKKIVSRKVDIELPLAMMIKTNQIEKEMLTGTSYLDLFKKVNRRRTEICTGVYTVQVCSGIYLIGYGVYFFEQAGLPIDQAFYMGIGFLAIGVLGSILSWGLLINFGRRTIYNYGLALLVVLLLIIGILDCAPNKIERPSIIWAQATLLIIWNFFYNLTIGPVGFSILCESSAVHVREKTIAFATAVQAAVGIGMTVAVPYLINPDQAALGGKIAFFFGGLAGISLVWAYFRVPETKGRTYAELDELFRLNVPSREFASFKLTAEN